jgi:hypothetical protein
MCKAQLTYVLSFKDPRTMKEKLMSPIPYDLFMLYDTTLHRISSGSTDSDSISISILSWLFHARRNLRMRELQAAIATRTGDRDITEYLISEAVIVETCGSLVVLDQVSGIISLAHEAVREFLKSRCQERLATPTGLAVTCLTYLLFPPFEEGECKSEELLQRRIDSYPFGPYAAQYWSQYIKGEGENDPLVVKLLMALAANQKTFASIVQLSTFEISGQWEVELRNQNKQLIHVVAENGLTQILRCLLQCDMKMVSTPISLLLHKLNHVAEWGSKY